MGQHSKFTIKILTLLTLSASVSAYAKDNGHCLGLYQSAEKTLFQEEQSKREDARSYTGVMAVSGTATALGIVTANPLVAVGAGVVSLSTYFAARHSQKEAERMANEFEGKVMESRMVFKAYADVTAHGRMESEEGKKFAVELKADPAQEAFLLQRLVEEMDSGALCDGQSIKSLGEVFAELRSGDAVVVQAIY